MISFYLLVASSRILSRTSDHISSRFPTHRRRTSRSGTGFKLFHRTRPSRVTTSSPASRNTRRCFITANRERLANAADNSPVVRGRAAIRSSNRRRVLSARALKTRSVRRLLTCDQMVTCDEGKSSQKEMLSRMDFCRKAERAYLQSSPIAEHFIIQLIRFSRVIIASVLDHSRYEVRRRRSSNTRIVKASWS